MNKKKAVARSTAPRTPTPPPDPHWAAAVMRAYRMILEESQTPLWGKRRRAHKARKPR